MRASAGVGVILEIAGRADPPRCGLSDQEGIVRQDPVFPCQFRYEVLMSLMRAGCCPAGLACSGLRRASATPRRSSTPPIAAPAACARALNVLVVDVQSLLQNSKSAKMVRQQIEQKRSEYAKEISQQEEALRRERDALQRQQASLSAEALNKKGREFQQKVNELDRSVQAKRQTLEKSNAEALERYRASC